MIKLATPGLESMANALRKMARALAEMQSAYLATGRYERATDEYQAQLLDAYDAWVKQIVKKIGNSPNDLDLAKHLIEEQIPDLQAALQNVARKSLPGAVNALNDTYVPSAEAYRMIASAITQNGNDLAGRLLPDLLDKLLRAVTEGKALQEAADAFESRIAAYAGAHWVLIQRLAADFVEQKQVEDDEIYPVRWKRTPDDRSCESCKAFEGEYDSYNAMLELTSQCVPGYFFNSPYKSACWGFCRCHLEFLMNGSWQRV